MARTAHARGNASSLADFTHLKHGVTPCPSGCIRNETPSHRARGIRKILTGRPSAIGNLLPFSSSQSARMNRCACNVAFATCNVISSSRRRHAASLD
ncbi:hypothetical protein OH687_19435 [Burkholderia anthina]|nr:hypothetical protein OH687_19435 [Burkholderia anthina]